MQNNLLITSAGRRVSLVRSFQEAYKNLSVDGKVFTGEMNPIMSAACRVSDGSFILPRVDHANYIDILLALCVNNNIRIIIPTIDTELLVLAKSRDMFLRHGVTIAISDLEFIERCRDKRRTNILFNEMNIDTPRLIDKNKPKFPLFVKPYDGSLSKDILLVKNISEWSNSLLKNDKLIFMEYLSPEEYQEFTIDVYYDNFGNLKCLVPRRRIEIRGGEISKGRTEKLDLYYILIEKLRTLKGARSCLTFQFFEHRKTHNIFGIEINPRFGGGFPLSYHSGADYPSFLIKEYLLKEQISFFDGWIANRVMLRYDDEIIFDE
jgi:carbamoyl-phosphate synthase large subunit